MRPEYRISWHNPLWPKLTPDNPEYLLWMNWQLMVTHCHDPKNKLYRRYSKRLITVCPDWRVFTEFRRWAKASGYRNGLVVARICNDAGYCPENCVWLTASERAARNARLALR